MTSQYLKVGIGDSVTFKVGKTERTLPISGKIRHPFVPPPDFGGPAYFFANGAGMERFGIPDGKFGAMLIRVTPYSVEHAKEVGTAIKDHLAKQGIGVAVTFYQDPNKHWGRFYVEGITLVLQVLAVISLLASVVLVLNTLTALITQQTNQIGILKAIGGTTSTIIKVYLTGVLAYGLLALLISLPLGMLVAFGMSQWFLNEFNIDYNTFQFSTQAVILSVLSAILVPLIAALWPVLSGAAHHRARGDRQLRSGRRLWRRLARPPGRAHRTAVAALALCHGVGQHVPPQSAAGSDATGVDHGRHHVPGGDEPLDLDHGHAQL